MDRGRDPNAPSLIFDGCLAPNEATSKLGLYSSDGIYGQAAYQRSDGPVQIVDLITNGSQISMD